MKSELISSNLIGWFIGCDLQFVWVLCEAACLFFVKLLVIFYTVKVIGGTMTNKLCCLYVIVVISLTNIWSQNEIIIDSTYSMQQFLSAWIRVSFSTNSEI